MVKSMFAAVAGLRAHQAKMDVISNNIANVNTYGYKAARATFRDVFYATSSGANDAGAVYGGTNPSQLGYGSKLGSIDSLMTGGGTATTDNPTDCMIQGNGFFLVGQKPTETAGVRNGIAVEDGLNDDGTINTNESAGKVNQTDISGLNMTRVGIFTFDGAGNMVDSNGRMVYGFASTYDSTNKTYSLNKKEITALRMPNKNSDPTKYEPMALKNITIGKDGSIVGTNDQNQTILVGKIALANVPNPNALERGENSYYTAKANTGTITVNPSGQNSTGTVESGCLEMSNVDLSKEFSDMITTERGFQANTRIITVTDSMLEELVNLKR
ncbi:flagellar hook-basal body complex protein [Aminipila terrae]|uniref:Flagellar hook protein FlgE n=1 Tax=Aminipila terrae TaxID=2697030 RepID=A0A6P1MBG5_9FIRM|nr:flagellar hook-basal body complex protein [Aminipila terrae]QHI71970.1 flagellar hook-basal body complex protein [Aminipila terrae]